MLGGSQSLEDYTIFSNSKEIMYWNIKSGNCHNNVPFINM